MAGRKAKKCSGGLIKQHAGAELREKIRLAIMRTLQVRRCLDVVTATLFWLDFCQEEGRRERAIGSKKQRTFDAAVGDIGVHCGRVVAPDGELVDVVDGAVGLWRVTIEEGPRRTESVDAEERERRRGGRGV
jgi:hypothetical protein